MNSYFANLSSRDIHVWLLVTCCYRSSPISKDPTVGSFKISLVCLPTLLLLIRHVFSSAAGRPHLETTKTVRDGRVETICDVPTPERYRALTSWRPNPHNFQVCPVGSSCHRSCAAARVDVLSEVTLVCCRWTFDILVYRQQMKVDCWLFEQRVIGHLSFEKREYVKLSR